MKLEPHPMAGASLIEVMDYLALRLAEVRDVNADDRNLRNASDRYDEAYMWVVAWVSSQAAVAAPAIDAQEGDDEGPCTTCYDTGITIQTERACSCEAGDQYRPPAVDAVPAGEVERFVIRRNGAFFRPNAQGYTTHIVAAGFYTREEADSYASVEGVTIEPLERYRAEANRLLAALSHGEGRK